MVEKATRAKRKLERDKLKIDLLGNISDKTLDILKELVRTANSNPIVGITISIMITDIAYKMKLLSETAYIGIMVAIGASEAGGVINDISDLIPGLKKASDTSTPSGTTLVYNDTSKQDYEVNGGK